MIFGMEVLILPVRVGIRCTTPATDGAQAVRTHVRRMPECLVEPNPVVVTLRC